MNTQIFNKFLPTKLGSDTVKIWLSSHRSKKTFNGSNISFIGDLSGNGNNYSQGVPNNQPLYVENVLNRRPALSLDGISDYMTCVNGSPLGIGNVDYDIFIVCKSNTDGATDDGILNFGNNPSLDRQVMIRQVSSERLATEWFGNTVFSQNGFFAQNDNVIINSSYDQTVGRTQYIDGVLRGSDSSTTLNLASGSPFLGALQGVSGTTNFWDGYFFELIVCNRKLNDEERVWMLQYLRNEYAFYEYKALDVVAHWSPRLSEKVFNGDKVSSITSIEGNNYNLTQASSANQPEYVSNSNINQLTGLRYNGVSSYYETTEPAIINALATNHTIMQVNKIVNGSTTSGCLYAGNTNQEGVLYDNSGNLIHFDFNFATIINEDTRNYDPWVFTGVANNSNYITYKNKTQKSSIADSLATPTSFSIGMELDAGSPTNFYEGDIGDIILFGKDLNSDELNFAQDWLIRTNNISI